MRKEIPLTWFILILCIVFGAFCFLSDNRAPKQTKSTQSIVQVENHKFGRYEQYQVQPENIIVKDSTTNILYFATLNKETGEYRIVSPVFGKRGQALRAGNEER